MAFDVREAEPDSTDMERFAEVIRRSNAEELGDLAQQRSVEDLRARARATSPRLRCFVVWLDHIPIGTMDMQILPELEPDMVEVHIRILKDYQGYGMAQKTLAHAEEVALAWGRTRITGVSAMRWEHGRNARFLRRAGFTELEKILRQDIRLPADPALLDVAAPPQYTIQTYRQIDEHLLLAFAHLLNRRGEVLMEFCMPLTAEEVGGLYAAGMSILVSLARKTDSDELVGYCELLTHPGTPIADQGMTFVVPEHEGAGLGKALKAATIAELNRMGGPRALRQFVQQADTGTPELNRELGFTDTAQYVKWQKSLL